MVNQRVAPSFSPLTALAVLLLSGCSLAPDYHRPEASVPAVWGQQSISPDNPTLSQSAGAFFRDKRLKQLIALTLEGNQDLKLSALNLQKAGAQYGVTRLSHLPTIGLSAVKTDAHLPGGIFDTVDTGAVTYHQYDVKLVSASWDMDFWGRLESLKEASLNEYLAADANARALKINLLEQTISAYFSYLTSRDAAMLAKEQVDLKQAVQTMMHETKQAGAIDNSRVMEADRDVDLARENLAQASLQSQREYNALQLLVGSPLPASLFEATADQDWRFPVLNAGLPSEALLKRPDIIAAEYELKAANARIGAARAAFFPSISITAEGGSSSAELGRLLSGGSASWNFAPSINLPIFDGGKNKANLDIATLDKQTEIMTYQKTIRQAFRDVSDALAGQATMNIQSANSHAVYASMLKQYQMDIQTQAAGKISQVQLLASQEALIDARKQFLMTHLQYLIQSVRLFAVLGGDNSV